jgi:hypothetical protein
VRIKPLLASQLVHLLLEFLVLPNGFAAVKRNRAPYTKVEKVGRVRVGKLGVKTVASIGEVRRIYKG